MRVVSACLCWRDAFFFGHRRTSICAETESVCMKASHRNFKTKQQAVGRRNKRLLCQLWAKHFEDRPAAFNDSPNQAPRLDPEVEQSRCTYPGPRSLSIPKFLVTSHIMPIVIFEHMAPSSCVRTKLTRPVHSAHEDLNGEKTHTVSCSA